MHWGSLWLAKSVSEKSRTLEARSTLNFPWLNAVLIQWLNPGLNLALWKALLCYTCFLSLISLCSLRIHFRRFLRSKAVAVSFLSVEIYLENAICRRKQVFVAAVIPGLPEDRSTLTKPIKHTLLVLQCNMTVSSCVGGLHV